jgi:transcriptional regulator NrdR family protein
VKKEGRKKNEMMEDLDEDKKRVVGMMKVVKSNGRAETFDGEKLKRSIRKAAVDAGLTEARTNKVVALVYKGIYPAFKGNTEVDSEELRGCILAELDSVAPAAAKAWRDFDGRYKKC